MILLHLINIFLLFFGIFLYVSNKNIVLYYYIVWTTFVVYLFSFLFPFDIEGVYLFNKYENLFLLIVVVLSWIWHDGTVKYNMFIIGILTAIFVFLFYLAYYHQISYAKYFNYWRSNLSFVLFFSYIYLNNCNTSNFVKFLIVFLVLQEIICILQLVIPSFFSASYVTEPGGIFDVITGTFPRANTAIDALDLIGLIIVLEFSNMCSKYKAVSIVLLISLLFLTFISAIRVALFSFLFTICIIFLFRTRSIKLRLLFFIVVLFFVVSLPYIQKADMGGSQRQVEGMESFSEKGVFDPKSTIFLSTYLIVEYFFDSPIMGSGLIYKDNGYGGFISEDTNNKTDVTLALTLTEYGILFTTLLVLLHYSLFFYRLKKNIKAKMVYIYVYMVLITIVDIGLHSLLHMLIMTLYLYYLRAKNAPKVLCYYDER